MTSLVCLRLCCVLPSTIWTSIHSPAKKMNLFSSTIVPEVSHQLKCVNINGCICVCMYVFTALKQKLSHIPEEIKDRSKFLLIIRHIASSIKDVLDAVNEVSQSHRNDPRMSREHRKVCMG